MRRPRHPDDFNSPMWVIGTISSQGEIRGRVAKSSGEHHTPEERLAGRPWRWCIWTQDWGDVRLGSQHLDRDDYMRVLDWLEDMGHADPDDPDWPPGANSP